MTAKGCTRRPWSPVAVNKVIASIDQVLADALAQGIVHTNIAAKVARVSNVHTDVATFTADEVEQLRAHFAKDRIGHAWELALYGLRRGEIAGLRWSDIDVEARTLVIANNRVSAGGATVENDPKSPASRRELPLPSRLVRVLRAAKKRQAIERLAFGDITARANTSCAMRSANRTTRRCCPGIGPMPLPRRVSGISSCTAVGTPRRR